MNHDRRVHAVVDGGEVVRYNRAGKWYLESAEGRRPLTMNEAVTLASSPGAQVRFDVPGGTRFDTLVRRAAGAR